MPDPVGYAAQRDPARWDRAIDYLTHCGGDAHVPLLAAGKGGLLNLVFASTRAASLPFGKIRRSSRPVIIVVCDDDATPTGPAGWRVAQQVCHWARGAIVHGAAAQRPHYEMAVAGAVACQRFVVVDTTSQFVASWMTLLGHVQTLAIVPRSGPHPVAEQSRRVH